MLIKEYRIPMPLTVDEYRIAQLYMIQKKSRQESEGEGSGVEILVNEPYTNQNPDGTTTSGQYTYKVYHIGKHLPSWFRSMIPQSAQRVEEEAWNAYPYTKTRYTCPFMEKFFIEIETKYFADPGTQDNAFNLSTEEMRHRGVEYIDIVKDSLLGPDSNPADDPAKYVSAKTGRGPLPKNWLQDWAQKRPRSIMCAYKLCRIDFRYWGMQSKVEKFINDIALRKTMISAHQQAWCWQDEWLGLTMADIRRLESEAQAALALKMKSNGIGGTSAEDEAASAYESDNQDEDGGNAKNHGADRKRSCGSASSTGLAGVANNPQRPSLHSMKQARPRISAAINSGSSSNLDLRGSGAMASGSSLLGLLETGGDSEDEYLTPEIAFNETGKSPDQGDTESLLLYFDANDDDQATSENFSEKLATLKEKASPPSSPPSKTLALFIVIHGGNFLDGYGSARTLIGCLPNPTADGSEISGKDPSRKATDSCMEGFEMRLNDINTFKATIRKVLKERLPQLVGRIAFKHVVLRDIYNQTLQLLTSLSPTGYLKLLDGLHHLTLPPIGFESPWTTNNWATETECGLPLAAIPLLACPEPDHSRGNHLVTLARTLLNEAYNEFLEQEPGFKGQTCLVTDMAGSIVAYDVLNLSSLQRSQTEVLNPPEISKELSFVPRHFFTLGSPLGLVLAQRLHTHPTSDKVEKSAFGSMERPCIIPPIVSQSEEEDIDNTCQIYNLFYQVDPFGIRLEPFMDPIFGLIPPCPADGSLPGGHRNSASCYTDFQGTGDYDLAKCILKNSHLFATAAKLDSPNPAVCSLPQSLCTMSDALVTSDINKLIDHWWGSKRIDYVLRKCPSGLGNHFPVSILPHIFHAGYWQSRHVSRFILEQVFSDHMVGGATDDTFLATNSPLYLTLPASGSEAPHLKEKWRRTKSTFVQNRNISSNHRANDVIINDSMPQTLVARFSYGPLDVITVGGQMVDIYVLNDEIASPVSAFALPRKSLSSEFVRDLVININSTRAAGPDSSYSVENVANGSPRIHPPSAVFGGGNDNSSWKYVGSAITHRNGRLQHTLRDEDRLPNGVYQIRMVVRSDLSSLYFDLAILPKGTEVVVFSIDGSFTASVSLSGKDPKIRPGCLDVVRHWASLGYFIIYISARPDMQMNTVTSWMCHHNFPWGFIYFVDHFSADGLKNKAIYLKYLSQDVGLKIHSAYGSSKDIPIYGSLGLPPDRIYALGKVPKKMYPDATILVDGYVPHLMLLKSIGGSVPAIGPGRIYHKKESLVTHDYSKQQKVNLSPFEIAPESSSDSHSIGARSSLRDKLWGGLGIKGSRRSPSGSSSGGGGASGSGKKTFTFSGHHYAGRNASRPNSVLGRHPSPAMEAEREEQASQPSALDRPAGDRKHSLSRLFKR